MVEESEVFKKLLIEEKDTLKDLAELVDKAAGIFKIEKPSGEIRFENFGDLSDKQRIYALLMGKYLAKKAGLEVNYTLSITEISKAIGRPLGNLSGLIKELQDKGFVEKTPERKYMIAYHRIKEAFEEILAKKKK
jgi:hypothetical protein